MTHQHQLGGYAVRLPDGTQGPTRATAHAARQAWTQDTGHGWRWYFTRGARTVKIPLPHIPLATPAANGATVYRICRVCGVAL
jgi:hypothetical protein